jgi:hypothetical protein
MKSLCKNCAMVALVLPHAVSVLLQMETQPRAALVELARG